MSAFIVSTQHIATIVGHVVYGQENNGIFDIWLSKCQKIIEKSDFIESDKALMEKIKAFENEYSLRDDRFKLLVEVLVHANYQGVQALYDQSTINETWGDEETTFKEVVSLSGKVDLNISEAQFFKACDCLEYQSSASDDYKKSFAAVFLKHAPMQIIRFSKSYQDADWEIS
jgi:hypothetical protein